MFVLYMCIYIIHITYIYLSKRDMLYIYVYICIYMLACGHEAPVVALAAVQPGGKPLIKIYYI